MVFENSLIAYYILLLCYHASVKEAGRLWNRRFMPLTTLKNLCYACAHSIIACTNWDPSTPWRPASRTEAPCEYHFAQVKKHYRGNPSVKDGILGCQRAHLDQFRDPQTLRSRIGKKSKAVEPIGIEEAEKLSELCFSRAVQFFCWISVSEASLKGDYG